MPTQITTISRVAEHTVESIHAAQLQVDATSLRIDQTLIPLASLSKVSSVKVYKAMPKVLLFGLTISLIVVAGLEPDFLLEQARNLLLAVLGLGLIYTFFDYQNWGERTGLLIMPNTGLAGSLVVLHDDEAFIEQVITTIDQVLHNPQLAYTIDCKQRTIEAK